MEINPLELSADALTPSSPKARGEGFGEMLNAGIQDVNQKLIKAKDRGDRLAAGDNVEIHDVMIAGQEADIAIRLAAQLRNQAMEAYREVMRMPI